jgi:hypothetical protein
MGVQRDGAMTEYIVAPWRKLYSSESLSLHELALVEPLTVGFHAVNRGDVSKNDTVVVFDRVREMIGFGPKAKPTSGVVNEALNATLSRTFNTSMTTIVVLLVIFFLGGEVLRGFIFAILFGIVVGTYSSLFIASPILYDTSKK